MTLRGLWTGRLRGYAIPLRDGLQEFEIPPSAWRSPSISNDGAVAADMVNGLKARLPSEPKGGLYFSCVARGPHMFGAPGKEMALIMERLGDVPLIGFYGNGEISNARLYGYTGVLALFL